MSDNPPLVGVIADQRERPFENCGKFKNDNFGAQDDGFQTACHYLMSSDAAVRGTLWRGALVANSKRLALGLKAVRAQTPQQLLPFAYRIAPAFHLRPRTFQDLGDGHSLHQALVRDDHDFSRQAFDAGASKLLAIGVWRGQGPWLPRKGDR